MAFQVGRDEDFLYLAIPWSRAKPRQKVKSLRVVASSGGKVLTDVRYKGRPVTVLVEAFITLASADWREEADVRVSRAEGKYRALSRQHRLAKLD